MKNTLKKKLIEHFFQSSCLKEYNYLNENHAIDIKNAKTKQVHNNPWRWIRDVIRPQHRTLLKKVAKTDLNA
jgi:hypothetical protein